MVGAEAVLIAAFGAGSSGSWLSTSNDGEARELRSTLPAASEAFCGSPVEETPYVALVSSALLSLRTVMPGVDGDGLGEEDRSDVLPAEDEALPGRTRDGVEDQEEEEA